MGKFLLFGLIILFLTACGQSGRLYLPEDDSVENAAVHGSDNISNRMSMNINIYNNHITP